MRVRPRAHRCDPKGGPRRGGHAGVRPAQIFFAYGRPGQKSRAPQDTRAPLHFRLDGRRCSRMIEGPASGRPRRGQSGFGGMTDTCQERYIETAALALVLHSLPSATDYSVRQETALGPGLERFLKTSKLCPNLCPNTIFFGTNLYQPLRLKSAKKPPNHWYLSVVVGIPATLGLQLTCKRSLVRVQVRPPSFIPAAEDNSGPAAGCR